MENFIKFNSVTKIFPGNDAATLDEMNLACKEGDIHIVLGFSGSGKSVTIKHALGLMRPDIGSVEVLGEDLAKSTKKSIQNLRKNFGMLFQSSALFDSLNVFDNLAFPIREFKKSWPESKVKTRVFELLEQVDLAGSHFKMIDELSGGMKKRVAMARALALKPKIIFCDEPTTGLDPVTSRRIDDLIVNTCKSIGASAFIISHDIKAALTISDKISFLHMGKIIEDGKPSEFVKSEHPVVKNFLKSAGVI